MPVTMYTADEYRAHGDARYNEGFADGLRSAESVDLSELRDQLLDVIARHEQGGIATPAQPKLIHANGSAPAPTKRQLRAGQTRNKENTYKRAVEIITKYGQLNEPMPIGDWVRLLQRHGYLVGQRYAVAYSCARSALTFLEQLGIVSRDRTNERYHRLTLLTRELPYPLEELGWTQVKTDKAHRSITRFGIPISQLTTEAN